MKALLDTTAQGIRIFYSKAERDSLVPILASYDELFTTTLSWYEFYHVFTTDLIRIYHAAVCADTFGDILYNLDDEYRSKTSLLTILAYLSDSSTTSPDPKMIADAALYELDGALQKRFTRSGKVKLKVLDITDCTMVKLFDADKIVRFPNDDSNQPPIVDFHDPEGCSRTRARCTISLHVEKNSAVLTNCSAALLAAGRDTAFQNTVKTVIQKPSMAKGENCHHISDWLMISSVKTDTHLITSDKDWKIIGSTLGYCYTSISTSQEFRKSSIRARLSKS